MYTWVSSHVFITCTLSDTGRNDTPPTDLPFSLILQRGLIAIGANPFSISNGSEG